MCKLRALSKSSPSDAGDDSVTELVFECDVDDNLSGDAQRGTSADIVGEEYLRAESFILVLGSCEAISLLQFVQFVFEGRDFLRFLDKLRLSFNRKLPLRFNDWVLGAEQPNGEHESDLVASNADGLLADWGIGLRRGEICSEEEEEEEWWLRATS